jgi:hypothetical protein
VEVRVIQEKGFGIIILDKEKSLRASSEPVQEPSSGQPFQSAKRKLVALNFGFLRCRKGQILSEKCFVLGNLPSSKLNRSVKVLAKKKHFAVGGTEKETK